MADGQDIRPETGTPAPGTSGQNARIEEFRLDAADAARRDDAADRARDFGSLDQPQGENDPANPNLHYGSRTFIEPGTDTDPRGAASDTGDIGLGQPTASEGRAGGGARPATQPDQTAGDPAPLADTRLDATLAGGIDTLDALTARIARLGAGLETADPTPAPTPAAAFADASADSAAAVSLPLVPETPDPEEVAGEAAAPDAPILNRPPTDILLDNGGVVENAPAGTVAAVLSAIDPDSGEVFTYEIADGSDLFEIVGNVILVREGAELDHESMPAVDLRITVRDSAGNTYTDSVTLDIRDVNEVATDIALDNASVAENAAGAVVGALSVTDPDAGDTHTYAVSDDRFEVVDGQLKLKDGVSLDHEEAASVSVEVTATDAGGLSRTESFDIAVGDVNEVATDITLDNASVAENAAGAVVGALSVTDPDAGDTHTYAVSDDRFEIVDGQLKLRDGVSLDHEEAASVSVEVTATDAGGLSRTETFNIAVGDVNEAPVDIDIEGAASTTVTVTFQSETAGYSNSLGVFHKDAEGNPVAGEIVFVDGNALTQGDTASVTFDGVDAADIGYFLIPDGADHNDGLTAGTRVSFVQDGDGNWQAVTEDGAALAGTRANVLFSGDGSLNPGSFDQTVEDGATISFEDQSLGGDADFTDIVFDAQITAAPSGMSVAENDAGAVVGTISTTDPDQGDTHTYTVSDGRFEVVDGQLKLKDGVALDHETADTVSVEVTSTDAGGLSYTESFDIAVGDVNDAASAPALSLGDTRRVIFSEGFESWDGAVVDRDGDHVRAQNGWSSDGAVELRDTGAGGNGSADGSLHHIELNNDPTDTYADAPNIARSVDTVDGGTYTLTFDYAPRPGYDASVNRIEVVWDGEVVATLSADGRGDSELSWQSHTLTLSGNGNPAEIEFREAGTDTNYGRGMMLDNIAMVETLEDAASGEAGTAIALPVVDAALTDTDGSETLAVTIGNLPAGAVLADDGHSFTAADGSTTADVTGWDLDSLTVTMPDDYSGTAALTVTATSTESEGGATATQTATLNVHVAEAADTAAPDYSHLNRIEAEDGGDSVEGTSGDDLIIGGAGDDEIEGGSGDDVIFGGAGDDEIEGGLGDDIIRGGAGNDEIEGGPGSDTFLFGFGDGRDEVEGDNGHWTDVIRLENEDGSRLEADDWTLSLDKGSVSQDQDGAMVLSEGAEGLIRLSDGSEISFEGIERIEW